MDDPLIWQLLLQVVLIAINALFAMTEIAVISLNESKVERLAEEGDKGAKKLLYLTRDSSRFLSTIQVVITLAGFLGSAFAADNFADRFVSLLQGWGVTSAWRRRTPSGWREGWRALSVPARSSLSPSCGF